MDVLLQQGRAEYKELLDLTEGIHRAYAHRYGMRYVRYDGPFVPDWTGHWDQIALMRALLGMPDVERVFWVDADAAIVGDEDLREGLGDGDLGMARHDGPPEHWNCGVLFVRNSPEVRGFFRAVIEGGPGEFPWYQQTLMNELIDGGYPVFVHRLHDRWNSTVGFTDVPDPVIMAWHGTPGPVNKLAAMRTGLRHGQV